MTNYYVDTNIWIDHAENRRNRFRPLGEWAFEFFKHCIDNKYPIIISDIVFKELSNEFSEKEAEKIVEFVKCRGILLDVKTKEMQIKEAAMFSRKLNIPVNDALHAILARDNNAILVTRDKHFYELADIVPVEKPESII